MIARAVRDRAAVFALLAGLVACAHPPPETAAPLSRTASVDGRYAGSATGSCGSSSSATMDVRDGRFTLDVDALLTLHGRAQRDGSLDATQPTQDGGEVNFTGRIEGHEVRGGSYNGRCAFTFSLLKLS